MSAILGLLRTQPVSEPIKYKQLSKKTTSRNVMPEGRSILIVAPTDSLKDSGKRRRKRAKEGR